MNNMLFKRCRTGALALGLCAAFAWGADTLTARAAAAPDSEPAYKSLYENGFYSQAIEDLSGKIKSSPDSLKQEYYRYLAYSYIATERIVEARALFMEMLVADSAFTLDPVRTSPKIYEVFRAALSEWQKQHQPVLPDSSAAIPLVVRDTASRPAPQPPAYAANPKKAPLEWVYIPVSLLPGGAGQFYNGANLKGAAISGVQAVCLGLAAWSYQKKNDSYSDRFGWYQDNKGQYETYLRLTQAGVVSFTVGYLYGICDALLHHKKQTKTSTKEAL
jgi:hypothetical protein